ncbi:hypothetical protein GCM10009860_15370 [Microbacterium mitrae]|uniref:Uncharacterized protein n=1 Tax=Microbacterium mitrae TaxID=664640 RepID=A0A5C8HKP7_9MICO|nr:hypothetical protein [Microbacterium mitrae]TXK03385.1 hypothetical protein FVP60_10875 [Microbacterium mitrae]
MNAHEDAVVVPLVPLHSEPTTEVMLRMLLNREALLIDRVEAPDRIYKSGMVAQSSGAFAKALGQAVGHAGRAVGQAGRAVPAEQLYRVILPTGAMARDLVPAIGGGFRGMVRAAGSTKFAGHARLVPAAGAAGVGGVAVAAGPLIAAVALATAGELLAQHQINRKLDSIRSVVIDLIVRQDDHERSVLTTASQQARKVASYLLDQAQIPSISSAPHAFGELDTLTNTYIDRLGRWRDAVAKHEGSDRVYTQDLMTALVGKKDNPIQEFERMVVQTYEALALRARVVVLEKIATEFSNADRSLPHVESVLRDELSLLADHQAGLVGLLDDLNVVQIDSSRVPIAFAGKGTLNARTSFGRLSRALHAAPDSLPMLTSADQTVLELSPSRAGFDVVVPQTA